MAINLGPGATLSDAQVQLQQLQQRQAIAAAMEKAGLATGQSSTVDAGVLKVANFGDPITKIINAFAGQNLQSGSTKIKRICRSSNLRSSRRELVTTSRKGQVLITTNRDLQKKLVLAPLPGLRNLTSLAPLKVLSRPKIPSFSK